MYISEDLADARAAAQKAMIESFTKAATDEKLAMDDRVKASKVVDRFVDTTIAHEIALLAAEYHNKSNRTQNKIVDQIKRLNDKHDEQH